MMIGNDRVAISIAIAAPSFAGQWTRQLQEPRWPGCKSSPPFGRMQLTSMQLLDSRPDPWPPTYNCSRALTSTLTLELSLASDTWPYISIIIDSTVLIPLLTNTTIQYDQDDRLNFHMTMTCCTMTMAGVAIDLAESRQDDTEARMISQMENWLGFSRTI